MSEIGKEEDLISIQMTDPYFGQNIGHQVLVTHGTDKCAGEFCCIHNPSSHHMREWEMIWRGDKKCMERLCPHGIGHPDPDDLAFQKTIGRGLVGVHGCDGCCRKENE